MISSSRSETTPTTRSGQLEKLSEGNLHRLHGRMGHEAVTVAQRRPIENLDHTVNQHVRAGQRIAGEQLHSKGVGRHRRTDDCQSGDGKIRVVDGVELVVADDQDPVLRPPCDSDQI